MCVSIPETVTVDPQPWCGVLSNMVGGMNWWCWMECAVSSLWNCLSISLCYSTVCRNSSDIQHMCDSTIIDVSVVTFNVKLQS